MEMDGVSSYHGEDEREQDNETLILDDSYLLGLVLSYIGGESLEDGDGNEKEEEGNHRGEEDEVEKESPMTKSLKKCIKAGCELWDLTSTLCYSRVLADHGLVQAIQGNLLIPSSSEESSNSFKVLACRLQEVSIGMLANLSCHQALVPLVLGERDLKSLFFNTVYSTDDPATLTEAFRFLSSIILHLKKGSSWYNILARDEFIQFTSFVLSNALDDALCYRAAEWAYLVLHRWPEVVGAPAEGEGEEHGGGGGGGGGSPPPPPPATAAAAAAVGLVAAAAGLLLPGGRRAEGLGQITIGETSCLEYVLRCIESFLFQLTDDPGLQKRREASQKFWITQSSSQINEVIPAVLEILLCCHEYGEEIRKTALIVLSGMEMCCKGQEYTSAVSNFLYCDGHKEHAVKLTENMLDLLESFLVESVKQAGHAKEEKAETDEDSAVYQYLESTCSLLPMCTSAMVSLWLPKYGGNGPNGCSLASNVTLLGYGNQSEREGSPAHAQSKTRLQQHDLVLVSPRQEQCAQLVCGAFRGFVDSCRMLLQGFKTDPPVTLLAAFGSDLSRLLRKIFLDLAQFVDKVMSYHESRYSTADMVPTEKAQDDEVVVPELRLVSQYLKSLC